MIEETKENESSVDFLKKNVTAIVFIGLILIVGTGIALSLRSSTDAIIEEKQEQIIVPQVNETIAWKLDQIALSVDSGFNSINKQIEQSLKTKEVRDEMFNRRMARVAERSLVDMDDVNHSCDLQFNRDMNVLRESATHINNAQQTILKMALYMTCASVATSSLVILSYICMSAMHSS